MKLIFTFLFITFQCCNKILCCEEEVLQYQACMKSSYGKKYKLDRADAISENDFKWQINQCFRQTLGPSCKNPFDETQGLTAPLEPSSNFDAYLQLNNTAGHTAHIDLKQILNSDQIIAQCGSAVANKLFRPEINKCMRQKLEFSENFTIPSFTAIDLLEVDLSSYFAYLAKNTVGQKTQLLNAIRGTAELLLLRARQNKYCSNIRSQETMAKCVQDALYEAELKLDPTPLKTARDKLTHFCGAQRNCARRLPERCEAVQERIPTVLSECLTPELLDRLFNLGKRQYFNCLMSKGFPKFNRLDTFLLSWNEEYRILDATIMEEFRDQIVGLNDSFLFFQQNDKHRAVETCDPNLKIYDPSSQEDKWDHFRIENAGPEYSVVISVPKGNLDQAGIESEHEVVRSRRKREVSKLTCNLVSELKTSIAVLHKTCNLPDPGNCFDPINLSTDSQVQQMDEKSILALIEGGFLNAQMGGMPDPPEIQFISRMIRPFKAYIFLLFSNLPEYTRLTNWGHE